MFNIQVMKRLGLLLLFFTLASCQAQKEDYASISMAEFISIYKQMGDLQILDVRTPEEYKEGFIKGAMLNNVFEPNFVDVAKRNLNKEKPIYVYCRSGRRSVKATKMLQEQGFSKVINVEGGYNAWIKQKE
ncbi:MAG: rhodanese [Flavobacteriaceae bacterium]|nr:rhodanese [Flavobacteriaceae bacterium]